MINVEAELNKHKNCRDRDELSRLISDYKNLAMQHANNLSMAGQYNMVALKLQAICDKLPAPRLKSIPTSTGSTPVKTATITKKESARISDEWNKKASSGKH